MYLHTPYCDEILTVILLLFSNYTWLVIIRVYAYNY